MVGLVGALRMVATRVEQSTLVDMWWVVWRKKKRLMGMG
jgi:hypothetical protein